VGYIKTTNGANPQDKVVIENDPLMVTRDTFGDPVVSESMSWIISKPIRHLTYNSGVERR
jgi:hypothetical protein